MAGDAASLLVPGVTGVSGAIRGAKSVAKAADGITGVAKVADNISDTAKAVGKKTSGYFKDVNGRWHRPNGQFASNAEVGLPPAKASAAKTTHGNSLSDKRTNYGYALVDKDNSNILKFGETIHPTKRYSKKYLEEHNAKMVIMEQGSKQDIHLWQHDMNEYFFQKYNEYPILNSKGW